jgi:hypothetical protein
MLHRSACNLGPLAVVAPLLEQMDVAAIIDRHLPPDPQLEFSHGQVLRLLLGARLCHPLALINVPGWAEESGAEYLWGIPADKLNDDRLGRALDAFFTQRHSILASVRGRYADSRRLASAADHALGQLSAGAHHPRLRRQRRQDDSRRPVFHRR